MNKSKVLKIVFESLEDFKKRTAREIKNSIAKNQKAKKPKNIIRFSSVREYQKVMSDQKYAILAAIHCFQPSSIYQLAKILNRPQPNVVRDCDLLEELGFIKQKLEKKGRKKKLPMLSFSYDSIEVSLSSFSYKIDFSDKVA